VRILSRLFRRLVVEKLSSACQAGKLQLFGMHVGTAARRRVGCLQQTTIWGPDEVLRYLARYTQRVAISNRRLVALDDKGVTFKWKDYRIEGSERYQLMMPTSSSAVFSCTSCYRASTASHTTVSSPANPAPKILHASARCWRFHSFQSMYQGRQRQA
jgi:hypothetical protein